MKAFSINVNAVKMASRMDSAYSIYKLAKAGHPGLLAGRESFAMFLPWAEEINAFIEQLDLEEINDDMLRSVQENAKIGFDTLKEVNLLLADIVKQRDLSNPGQIRWDVGGRFYKIKLLPDENVQLRDEVRE